MHIFIFIHTIPTVDIWILIDWFDVVAVQQISICGWRNNNNNIKTGTKYKNITIQYDCRKNMPRLWSQYDNNIICNNKTPPIIVLKRANEFRLPSYIVRNEDIESSNEYHGGWWRTKEKISIINREKCALGVRKKCIK